MCQGLSIPDWNQHKVKWEHLKNIPFPKAPGRKTIDILIGSDHPELTLALIECYGPIGAPVARKTPLGWTCVGRLPALSSAKRIVYARTFRIQTLYETRLDEQLREMWEMDSLGVRNSNAFLGVKFPATILFGVWGGAVQFYSATFLILTLSTILNA